MCNKRYKPFSKVMNEKTDFFGCGLVLLLSQELVINFSKPVVAFHIKYIDIYFLYILPSKCH